MKKRITLTETDNLVADDREHVYQVQDDTNISIYDLLSLYLRKRRVIAASVLGTALLTALIVFLLPNQYRSTASLLPSGTQDKIADLKRLAGLGALAMTDESSSELFPTILRSYGIQDQVLSRRFNFDNDGKSVTLTLTEYFDQPNPDKLRKQLSEITSIGVDKKTGVIELAVETDYPALSQQVVTAYIEELESFNLYKRRSQARENASYLAKQIEQTKVEMGKVEDELESYQMSNRNWLEGSSPDMLKTIARLQREVEIQNKKYLYLTQEYEIAKLDAQKDVPIVRILDKPSLPVLKSSPKRGLLIAGATIAVFLAALFLLCFQEIVRRRSQTGFEHNPADQLRHEFAEAFPNVANIARRTAKTSETEQVTS